MFINISSLPGQNEGTLVMVEEEVSCTLPKYTDLHTHYSLKSPVTGIRHLLKNQENIKWLKKFPVLDNIQEFEKMAQCPGWGFHPEKSGVTEAEYVWAKKKVTCQWFFRKTYSLPGHLTIFFRFSRYFPPLENTLVTFQVFQDVWEPWLQWRRRAR